MQHSVIMVFIQNHTHKENYISRWKNGKKFNPRSCSRNERFNGVYGNRYVKGCFNSGTGKRAISKGLILPEKPVRQMINEDSWFAGYSTNYTIAAWGGYQDRTPMTSFPRRTICPTRLI